MSGEEARRGCAAGRPAVVGSLGVGAAGRPEPSRSPAAWLAWTGLGWARGRAREAEAGQAVGWGHEAGLGINLRRLCGWPVRGGQGVPLCEEADDELFY